MVGGAEKVRPAGKLRGVLGRIDQGECQQGHYEEVNKPRRSGVVHLVFIIDTDKSVAAIVTGVLLVLTITQRTMLLLCTRPEMIRL